MAAGICVDLTVDQDSSAENRSLWGTTNTKRVSILRGIAKKMRISTLSRWVSFLSSFFSLWRYFFDFDFDFDFGSNPTAVDSPISATGFSVLLLVGNFPALRIMPASGGKTTVRE